MVGCKTILPSNTAGKISEAGAMGNTVVQGVGNADTEATLERKEKAAVITHRTGDRFVVTAKPKNGENIFSLIREQGEENGPQDKVTAQIAEIQIEYYPTDGSTTRLSGTETKASTGASKEDKAAITSEILKNTKTIQYVGILLVVAGAGVGWFFKVPMQGATIGGVGVALIILQSTLANPIWSWVMVIALFGIPFFWLYHLYKNRKEKIHLAEKLENTTANKSTNESAAAAPVK